MEVYKIQRIHVEGNVILTTINEISVQQVFNYLCANLDQFRVGSEFVAICGIHGSEHGFIVVSEILIIMQHLTIFWSMNAAYYHKFRTNSELIQISTQIIEYLLNWYFIYCCQNDIAFHMNSLNFVDLHVSLLLKKCSN